MPFDAVVTKAVVFELNQLLLGGRIDKIYQPEPDELLINIRSLGKNHKLLLTANASFPRIHLTNLVKENPINAPVFCMLLRKHLTGGKILSINFHDFERIISIEIESLTELGDLLTKKLIIEIMGKHSNIILLNSENKILDCIKHVDNEMSRIREVMPARQYFLPPTQNKISPSSLSIEDFINKLSIDNDDISVNKYILNNIKGFSPYLCTAICNDCSLDSAKKITDLTTSELNKLKASLSKIISMILDNNFLPFIEYSDDIPLDFHCLNLKNLNSSYRKFSSINTCLDIFYTQKDEFNRLKSKKSDLLKVINNNINRCLKKSKLQEKLLKEVSNRDIFKLYGELLISNIYQIPLNQNSVTLNNFYSKNYEKIDVPLDPYITPQQNAQKYFKKYSKAKITFEYQTKQLEDTLNELQYLESVLHMLNSCASVHEIDDIRTELIEQNYILSKNAQKKRKISNSSAPMKFISSDGFTIFVGRNNTQNDFLTLKFASSNDLWLHTKNIPGSHVVIKKQRNEIPQQTIYQAAMLAAYFSKARNSSSVPVDYTQIKNVKKPTGAKPGMVIYFNNKTIYITPDKNSTIFIQNSEFTKSNT